MVSYQLLAKAYWFADRVHSEQVRKYTGLPYMTHCAAVSKLVAQYDLPDTWVAAALMHDCVEDARNPGEVALAIRQIFGDGVANLVMEVTDVSKPSDGNRAVRKTIDREHLAKASPGGMTIKLADLIDNTNDIVAHDENFAKVYIEEKKLLLPLLTKGDYRLYETARTTLIKAEREILWKKLQK